MRLYATSFIHIQFWVSKQSMSQWRIRFWSYFVQRWKIALFHTEVADCVNNIGLTPLNLKMFLRACIYLAPHVLLMQCTIIMLCTRNNIVKLQGTFIMLCTRNMSSNCNKIWLIHKKIFITKIHFIIVEHSMFSRTYCNLSDVTCQWTFCQIWYFL